MFYSCHSCQVALKNWFGFVGHYRFKHPGEPLPERDEVASEEVPEGYTTSTTRQVKAKPRTESEEEVGEKEPVSKPAATTSEAAFEVDELPREPAELFYTILRLKGIPDAKSKQLQREFKLSPWMWGDAQEISGLLKGAKLGTSPDWIRSFLKHYGSNVELVAEGGEVSFVSPGRRGRDEFFGRLEPQASDPISRYIQYQILKDEHREREVAPPSVSPEVLSELQAMRKDYAEVQKSYKELLDEFKEEQGKAEAEKHEMALEARLTKQDEKMEKLLEALNKPQEKDESQSQWLRAYLDEKDKRYEGVIKDLGDKLASATTQVREAVQKAVNVRAEVLSEEEDRRDKIKKEMEDSGFAPRKKDTEEKVLEIVEGQLIPGAISEIREVRKMATSFLTGTAQTGGVVPPIQQPISPEEATKIAEAMEIEAKLRG